MAALDATGEAEAIVALVSEADRAAARRSAASAAIGAEPRDRAAVKSAKFSSEVARLHANTKRGIAALNGPSVRTLRDYRTLPTRYVKFTSRESALRLARDPRVISITRDVEGGTMDVESLPVIGQPEVASTGNRGAGAAVAVLDTGVDYTRAAFGSCKAPSPDCSVVHAQDFAPDDRKLDADRGKHGTNVAGIALAVAPEAKIVSLDVFGNKGTWFGTDVLDAVAWVIENQAAYNIRAMNLSLGNSSIHFTNECGHLPFAGPFANAAEAGVVPVVASGNSAYVSGSYKSGVAYPACTPGAVRVGATYDSAFGTFVVDRSTGWFTKEVICSDNTAVDKVACFSQGGPLLSIWAPGSKITAAGITQSGTSQAAPHVSGAVATLSAAYPTASPYDTAFALSHSNSLFSDPREDHSLGYVFVPRLDLPSAMKALAARMKPRATGDIFVLALETEGQDELAVSPVLENAGYNVTVGSALPANLASFGQVWAFSTYEGYPADVRVALIDYVLEGGSLLMNSEHSCCATTNAHAEIIMDDILEANVSVETVCAQPCNQVTAEPLNPDAFGSVSATPNANATLGTDAVGRYSGVPPANALLLHGGQPEQVGATVWGPEHTRSKLGRLITVADSNWSDSGWFEAYNVPFAENVAAYLAQ